MEISSLSFYCLTAGSVSNALVGWRTLISTGDSQITYLKPSTGHHTSGTPNQHLGFSGPSVPEIALAHCLGKHHLESSKSLLNPQSLTCQTVILAAGGKCPRTGIHKIYRKRSVRISVPIQTHNPRFLALACYK